MEIQDYIVNVAPIYLIEILAAIAGTYYLKKGSSLRSTKWLVNFLWVTVLVEFVSIYPPIAYFSEYKYFSFVEGTTFANYTWVYNAYIVVSFTFFSYYFGSFLDSRPMRQIVKYSTISYVIAAIGYLLIKETYFIEISQFSNIAGTLLLLAVIILFYFQLLKSDIILNLIYFLPFYISIGVLVFNLCLTPLDIFSEYYSGKNSSLWNFKNMVYLFSNLFMYSSFILGFIICRRKKSY